MERNQTVAWLALKAVPGIGDVLYRRLIERFGSPQAVFAAPEQDLLRVEGVRRESVVVIKSPEKSGSIWDDSRWVENSSVQICTWLDQDYPALLRQIHDPPPFFFIRGRLDSQDLQAIGMVGSRNCSEYGRSIANRLAGELSLLGYTIVSGLARGIDAAAHWGALNAGGRTLAVVGCGLDVPYPIEHTSLKASIIENGALLSEFPPGTSPLPENFPRRNRLISGLSLGVVVVEATEKSGALITALCALDQGREVFAVPGPIGSKTSQGTHRLIQQGAKLVDRVEDILEELPRIMNRPAYRQAPQNATSEGGLSLNLTSGEKRMYELLSQNPQHLDDLTVHLRISPSEIMGLLLQLELKGAVQQLAGQRYIRLEP